MHTDCTKAIFHVGDIDKSKLKITLKDAKSGAAITPSVSLGCAKSGFVSVSGLAPNTAYAYELSSDGATVAGKFKTAPDYKNRTPPPDFTFAVLGKNHINDQPFDVPFRTNGGEYEIFEAIAAANPDFAIWACGADTLRPADTGSLEAMLARFAKSRAKKSARKLLLNAPNYGVMADAASGVGVADKHSPAAANARAAFEAIWALPQKNADGAYYAFSYADADFFVLDCCSQRSNLDFKQYMPQILGQEQIEWLMANLQASKANFKIIILNTPLANPVKSPENFTFAAGERKQLMDFLVLKRIEGVVVISANKNFGEITKFVRAGGYPIYDLTAGALTDRPAEDVQEMNYFRVPNSLVKCRSYALVKIDGPENDRRITLSFFDSKGKQLFALTLKLSQLKGS